MCASTHDIFKFMQLLVVAAAAAEELAEPFLVGETGRQWVAWQERAPQAGPRTCGQPRYR